ncbi:hypothetical protein [Actinomadura chokoriensis]|uniref:DUF222 domain-containing protein n=1 Tax=Actinomadura chokoriensis TaxID=454156 RepID=A0ABV4QSF7_9ACTN
MATFGEMTNLANEHLTDLRNQLHLARFERDIRSRTTVPELARLAHVLARYHDQITDGFGVPHPASAGVRVAAHRAGDFIKQAEELLGPPADTETPRSALAQKLRATSIALGCGLDLLSTHFPTAHDHAASATAVVIAAPDSARSLLHQLSIHTSTVGHLAWRTATPTSQAGVLLLKAAFISHIHSENQASPPITAIQPQHTPDRIPPAVGENVTQALAGIDASIQRLSNPQTMTSVTTWRYLARAAAIICDIDSKTIRQLIHRIDELNEPERLPALKEAASQVQHTGRTWRTIIRRWDEHIGHYGNPATGPATDASDLIIRLGRLIHSDPAWTPSPQASSRLKPPHELAPDLHQAASLATVTLKTIEGCNNLAAHHHAAINDAAAIGAVNRHQKYPTHLPRVPVSVRQLSTRYDAARIQGSHAITTLGQAIQALTSPNPTPREVRLIIRRATLIDEENQPVLAASAFPTPLSELLSSSNNCERTPTPIPFSHVENRYRRSGRDDGNVC